MSSPEASNRFFDQPILNSPYEYPTRHWELDDEGQPTQQIIETRRRAEFITPIPKPKKRKGSATRSSSSSTRAKGSRPRQQQYDPTSIINELRQQVDQWRASAQPERLAGHAGNGPPAPALAAPRLQRHPPVLLPGRSGRDGHLADGGRPAIGKTGKRFLEHLANANNDANPELDAAGAEARDRRRQDHGHGDADRLADDQRRAPTPAASTSPAAF